MRVIATYTADLYDNTNVFEITVVIDCDSDRLRIRTKTRTEP